MKGYAGTLLEIDLSRQAISKKPLEETFARDYIGGIGFNARFLYDLIPAGADPLGPDNVLAFSAGTLIGSPFPTAARTEVSAKSPATNLFGTTNSGSFWGLRLKSAGYDSVVITGASDTPVYVFIENEQVEIRDARHLWGKTTWETMDALRDRYYDCEAALIGPGGENRVRFANIENGYFGGWGRTGMGAVMGSKNLKAIVIRGNQGIRPADPKKVMDLSKAGQEKIMSATSYAPFAEYGSMNATIPYDKFKALSIHNHSKGHLPGWIDKFKRTVVDDYSNRHVACQSCVIACNHWVEIPDGKYAGTKIKDMEVTPTVAFGGNVGLEVEPTIYASGICRQNSLDMVSAAGVVAFAMDLFQHGLITTEDVGYPLNWGDDEAAFRLLDDIIHRRGIGDILAEGVLRASRHFDGAEPLAMHVSGLELPMIDPRNRWSTWSFGALTNIRGGDHLRSRNPIENLRFNVNKDEYSEAFGHKPKMYDRLDMPEELKKQAIDLENDTVDIARMSKWSEDLINLSNSIGICIRPPVYETIGPTILADIYTAHTGISMTPEALMQSSERSWNLMKLFNIREGEKREQLRFPDRFYTEEIYGGKLSDEKVNRVLSRYYETRGWDPERGTPLVSKMTELHLENEYRQAISNE